MRNFETDMLSVFGRSDGSWERRPDFKMARIIWNFM